MNNCAQGGTVIASLTHHLNGLEEEKATQIFRRGGFYALYKVEGQKANFDYLKATNQEEADAAYQNLYETKLAKALRRRGKQSIKAVRARWDAAFDQGEIFLLDPEPNYEPIKSSVSAT
jgi:hypothetical protein